jgi:hypothetical protein
MTQWRPLTRALADTHCPARRRKVVEALPPVVRALRTELRASKRNAAWRLDHAVEAALTAAELALAEATQSNPPGRKRSRMEMEDVDA